MWFILTSDHWLEQFLFALGVSRKVIQKIGEVFFFTWARATLLWWQNVGYICVDRISEFCISKYSYFVRWNYLHCNYSLSYKGWPQSQTIEFEYKSQITFWLNQTLCSFSSSNLLKYYGLMKLWEFWDLSNLETSF